MKGVEVVDHVADILYTFSGRLQLMKWDPGANAVGRVYQVPPCLWGTKFGLWDEVRQRGLAIGTIGVT